MTAYVHRTRVERPLLRVGTALAHGFRSGLRGLQYGRMVSVLNRLSDRHLKEAGLRRGDIPEHARRAIYGDE